MKKLLASVSVLAFAASAGAQDTTPELYDAQGDYTDGDNGNTWKLTNPSGPSDWWNSFKSTDLAGVTAAALAADFVETAGIPGTHREFGLYPDLGAGVPDVLNPIALTILPPVVPANDAFDTDSYYSIPKTDIGTGAVHVAAEYIAGDSHCWMSSDSDSFQGRTFFSTSSYAGGATPFTTEIDMYVGSPHAGNPGDLLFNGSTNASVLLASDPVVCTEFFGSAISTRFILYFAVGGNPFIQLLPAGLTVTDNVFAGPCPQSWALCASLSCNTPSGAGLEFNTIWQDQVDLKANGKPKLKVGASAFLTLDGTGCSSTGGGCFGQQDDCILDSTIWKVANPAGPSDWFNVNHGVPTSGVTNLLSADVSSFDFCAIGPAWAEVGIYPSNLTVDPTGTTPDVTNPLAAVTGASAAMAVSASDGSCPVTVYDTPDYAVDSAAANGVHVAAQWPNGDSCIWLGSDTDGIDSACGNPIPNSGTTSLFTSSSYASPGAQFTGANWIMQIDWN